MVVGWHTCNIWYEQIVECGSDVQKAEERNCQDRMKLKNKNYIILSSRCRLTAYIAHIIF